MSVQFPLVVLHNVSSSSKCVDFARICVAMGFKNVVITKATGGAATGGVPGAQKLVAQKGGNLFYLQSLEDVKEVFEIDELYVMAPPSYGEHVFTDELANEVLGKRTAIVFGGNDPGLSRKDLEAGKSVHLDLPEDPGTIGTLAITLYKLGTINNKIKKTS